MKKLSIVLAALALIAGFGAMQVEAAPTDTIAVTVTLQNISVRVAPDAWALGTKTTDSTTTEACIATNDGNVNENLDIAVSNSGNWAAGAAAGADIFAMDFQIGVGPWTNITNPGVDLVNALAPGDQAFTLRFSAPTSTTSYDQQAITVTVTAAAA